MWKFARSTWYTNIQLKLLSYQSKIWFFSIVYVPFDVNRLTDELQIEFRIQPSNSYALWDMEINQIECTHKAAIVTPDEKQGWLFIYYENNIFELFFTLQKELHSDQNT